MVFEEWMEDLGFIAVDGIGKAPLEIADEETWRSYFERDFDPVDALLDFIGESQTIV